MSKATSSINTAFRDGILIPVPLATSAIVLMGTFAVIGADGYAISSDAVGGADQTCLGVWENDAENPVGNTDSVYGLVRRNKQFLVANSTTDPVAQADIGQIVYVADNQTISKTDNGGVLPVAGAFMGFDTEETTFAWVEIV